MADTEGNVVAGGLEKFKIYVRTRKGTVLSAEIILSFIILICYASSLYGGYTAVAICEMVISIIFLVVFTMDLHKTVLAVNWPWSDLIRAVIGASLYLITSLICVIGGAGDGARIAGGVFGLLAGFLFAYDAYTVYLDIKSSRQNTAAPTGDKV